MKNGYAYAQGAFVRRARALRTPSRLINDETMITPTQNALRMANSKKLRFMSLSSLSIPLGASATAELSPGISDCCCSCPESGSALRVSVVAAFEVTVRWHALWHD